MAIKTDSVTHTTIKSVSEIADAIRSAAQQVRADNMERITKNDPLGGIGLAEPSIAVALSGRLGFLNALKSFTGAARDMWLVQVYVYDQGDEREIALVAVGDSLWAQGLAQSSRQQTIDFKTSRQKRDEISDIILYQ